MKVFCGVILSIATVFTLSSCSSDEYSRRQDACIIHRDLPGTTYERVKIVGEADEAHWEVVFPDSSSHEIQIVSKSTISTVGCPFSFPGHGLLIDSFRPAESK